VPTGIKNGLRLAVRMGLQEGVEAEGLLLGGAGRSRQPRPVFKSLWQGQCYAAAGEAASNFWWLANLRFDTRAKEKATYSYQGAAGLEGEVVVTAHAHRAFAKVILIREIARPDMGVKLMEMVKLLPDLGFIIGIGGHTHKAGNADVSRFRLLLPLLDEGLQFSVIKAEFGFFFCNVHLEEAVNDAVVFGSLFVDLLEQAKAVYCMDHGNKGGDVFYFVGLKMANEMPFNVLGKLRLFLHQFLYVIFTEYAVAGIIKFLDIGSRFGFGNGYQFGSVRKERLLHLLISG
jgi:hypothetical protein